MLECYSCVQGQVGAGGEATVAPAAGFWKRVRLVVVWGVVVLADGLVVEFEGAVVGRDGV